MCARALVWPRVCDRACVRACVRMRAWLCVGVRACVSVRASVCVRALVGPRCVRAGGRVCLCACVAACKHLFARVASCPKRLIFNLI